MKNHLKKVDPDKWDKIVQRMKDKERKEHNTMDKNVEKVITQLRDREEEGLRKYGVNTERTDLTSLEWLQHLQEELMDASVYIEKLKNEIK
jgi:histidinol dehydrogenase